LIRRIKRLVTRLNCCLYGHRLGERRYLPRNPFIIGDSRHFLPTAMWTGEEKNALRYNILEQWWNGWEWKPRRTMEVDRATARKLLGYAHAQSSVE